MINNIVSLSEIFSTAEVVSHSLEKIKKIPIKLSIKSKFESFPNLDLTKNIFTTGTLYEVKKEIQKRYYLDPIFIDFSKFNNADLFSDSNGKYLCFILNLENTSTSSLSSLKKEKLEKKYVLNLQKSREL